jgi:AraC-like DNA-binding protein
MAYTPQTGPAKSAEGEQRVGGLVNAPALMRELGADPAIVLQAAGLAADALDNADATVTYLAAARMLAASVEQTGRRDFGILLGTRAKLDQFGPLGRLMRSAPTLGDALMAYMANQQRYARGAVAYLLTFGDTTVIGYAIYQSGVPAVDQIADLVVAIATAFVRELCGAIPEEILLARAAPADLKPYRRLLPAPVRFDAEQIGIALPGHLLSRPIPAADAAAYAEIQKMVSAYWAVTEPDIKVNLMRLLRPRIVAGGPSIEAAAASLALHPRSLNRRLQEAGTSYRAVLSEARFEVARQLLECTRLDLRAIAMALGYAEPSVFTHAFRRWAGVTPSLWRRQAAGGVP